MKRIHFLSSQLRRHPSIVPALLSACLLNAPLFSQPSGLKVASGKATLHPAANELLIEASHKAILNWDEFSILSHEKTHFALPNSKSGVLNRVNGANPSEIMGTLSSNGHVYLINSNGIIIGSQAVVSVAGFVASTLALQDEDFLNSDSLTFEKISDGSIQIEGKIEAEEGDIVLLSSKIENRGLLKAPQGTVALGASDKLVYYPKENAKIGIILNSGRDSSESLEGTRILQLGTIEALQAEIRASGNPYAYAIQNGGCINAHNVLEQGGRILLVSENGAVENSGHLLAKNSDGVGGSVDILGRSVHLTPDSFIDASGEAGGGQVLVGSNLSSTFSTELTVVDSGSTIYVDALRTGNGGTVLIWAERAVGFYGEIFARGGSSQGDGGFVEVSGLGKYDFRGLTDRTAPNGKAGLLLLDPTNITISNAATTGGITFVANTYADTNNLGTQNIQISDIIASLNLGNVTVTTASAVAQAGNIIISDTFDWNTAPPPGTRLLFRADEDVNVNAPVLNNTTTAGNIIEFNSQSDINVNANITNNGVGAGEILFRAGFVAPVGLANVMVASGVVVTNTSAGEILFSSLGDDCNIEGALVCSGTGGIRLTCGGTGDVEVLGTGSVSFTNGTFTVLTASAGFITLGGAYDFQGSSSIAVTGGGTVMVSPSSFSFDSTGSAVFQCIGLGPGANVLLVNTSLGANAYELVNGVFSLSAAQGVQFQGSIVKDSAETLFLTAGATSATLAGGTIDINNGDVIISAVTIAALGVSTGTVNVDTTGQVNISSAGLGTSAVSILGPVNFINGDVNLNANGSTNFANLVNYNGGTLDVISGNDVVINGTLNVNSTNPLNITTTGVTTPSEFFLLGAMTGTAGPINLNIHDSATFNGPVTLNTAQTFTINSVNGGINVNRVITNSSTGQILAFCPGDLFIGTLVGSVASRLGSAGGNTILDVGGGLNILSGSGAGATSTLGQVGGGGSVFATVGGTTVIEGNANNIASITTDGGVNMDIGGDLIMTADQLLAGTGESRIVAGTGITVNATNMSLNGFSGGPQVLVETTSGNIQLVALNNFILDSNGQVVNQGTGEITIVIDEQVPSPPGFGPGVFELDANTQIGRVGGGLLRIFTSIPGQTIVDGLLNGIALPAVGGPISPIEQYGVYFSSFSGGFGIPFTIFYKSTGVLPPPDLGPPGKDIAFVVAELQRILYRFEGGLSSSPFYLCGSIEETGTTIFRKRLFYPQHFLVPFTDEFDCDCVRDPDNCDAIFPR